jgi:Calpain family cysteine protease
MQSETKIFDIEFTDRDLYGSHGPVAADVKQGDIGDCYLMATLASLVHSEPERIKKAIAYDTNAKCFVVDMYKRSGKLVHIRVTSKDIWKLKSEGGIIQKIGSKYVIWPAVIETAFAVMHDSSPKDGLDDGVSHIGRGGLIQDGMAALVGFKGKQLKLLRFKRETGLNYQESVNLLGCRIETALHQKNFVVLATSREGIFDDYMSKAKSDSLMVAKALQQKIQTAPNYLPPDGLRDKHGYSVMAMHEVTPNKWFITLRNPKAHNNYIGGEPSPHPNKPSSAFVYLDFAKLLACGGVAEFRVSVHR